MQEFLRDLLACPACHGSLDWTIVDRRADRIEEAEARCRRCQASYEVRDGIGLFLTPDLPRDDLWEQADSGLSQYLREHPEVEAQLMDAPLDDLNPTDQFFRSMILEERGQFAAARIASDVAWSGLYTLDYLSGAASQFNYIIKQLEMGSGPIVDLASGKGYLVEDMAQRLARPIVATDFSPRVLRGDRRRLAFFDRYDQISLIACDARRLPFKNDSVSTLTTNVGLANIRESSEVLKELRRVVDGAFYAVHHFYPQEDVANAAVIQQIGLADMLFAHTAWPLFEAAGWRVAVENEYLGLAKPTPMSQIFEGATIDTLPSADTTLRWCTLVAH